MVFGLKSTDLSQAKSLVGVINAKSTELGLLNIRLFTSPPSYGLLAGNGLFGKHLKQDPDWSTE
ncbi:MAG: hypothetical protein K0U41_03995 [Gammaproteobacteria bacterium]|nr:hypothetical protein [Gammaproteobacteria bacterium]